MILGRHFGCGIKGDLGLISAVGVGASMTMYITKYKALFLVAAFWFCLGLFGPFEESALAAEGDSQATKNLREIMSIAEKNYLEDINEKQLMERAIKGMVQSLENSSYLTKEEFKQSEEDAKREFGGLGLEIALKDGVLTVISPIQGSPAEQAGLKPGDRIVKIDGETTENTTLLKAVRKMRGPTGTKVTVSVTREEFAEPRDFSLIRVIIRRSTLKKQLLEEGYPYIRLVSFQEGAHSDLVQAFKDFGAEDRIRGVILDLRNNPGGLLDQAVKVGSLFIDGGLITFTEGRARDASKRFRADNKERNYKFKIAVLINQGTASGSEILAAALQDHDRALVFGTKSAGQASLRNFMRLKDGSALFLTTALFYSPKGREIHKVGIQPDVDLKKEVEEDQKALPKGQRLSSEGKLDLSADIVARKALDWLKSETTVIQHKAALQ